MAKWIGSPSYTRGRQGKKVNKLVVHWIVGRLSAADAVFKNPKYQTSAHYAVGGRKVHQYVNEKDAAWHAGNWQANLTSIGIEHEGGPNLPIAASTYKTSAKLIADICRRHKIKPSKSTIVPHKKFIATACPGTLNINKLIKDANAILNPPKKPKAVKQVWRVFVGGTQVAAYSSFSNAVAGWERHYPEGIIKDPKGKNVTPKPAPKPEPETKPEAPPEEPKTKEGVGELDEEVKDVKTVNQPTLQPTNKVGAGAAAGAVTAILAWVFKVELPAEVAVALTTLVYFVIAWLTKNKA